MYQYYPSQFFVLSFSSLLLFPSTLFALFLLAIILTDLFIYIIDIHTVKCMISELSFITRSTSTSGTVACSSISTCYTSTRLPHTYAYVLSHPMFFSWSLTYRYICPLFITIVQCIMIFILSCFSSFHARLNFNISMSSLQCNSARRQQQMTKQG